MIISDLIKEIKYGRLSPPEKMITDNLSNLIIVKLHERNIYIKNNNILCSHHLKYNILYMHYYIFYSELREFFNGEMECYEFIDKQVEYILNIKLFTPIRYFGTKDMVRNLRHLKIKLIYKL